MEQLDFFIGSQTPGRYISYLEDYESEKWQIISLRGTPGCGKTDALQKAAQQMEGRKEIWHCPCDMGGIDGVLSLEKKRLILDSEWPHAFFSFYPLVSHTELEFYSCMDRVPLSTQKEKLCEWIRKKEDCFKRSQSYLQGMRTLMQDGYSLLLPGVRTEKITRFARRIALQEFQKQPHLPQEHRRFLSAFTPNGYLFFPHTITTLCDRIYVFYDEFPSLQRLVLQAIRSFLVEYGYEFYACYSPLSPFDFLEHLLVPDLRLGFITLHSKEQAKSFSPVRTVSFYRFLSLSRNRDIKKKIQISKGTFEELQREATACLKDAFHFHNQTMEIYGTALNLQAYQKKLLKLDELLASLGS